MVRGAERSAETPGLALRCHPVSLLVTSWPWRSLVYLVTTPFVVAAWLVTCWMLLPLAGIPLGWVERWRLRWIDRGTVPNPHTGVQSRRLSVRVRHRIRESITRTELLYGLLLIPLSLLNLTVMVLVLLVPAALGAASGLLVALLALGVDPAVIDPTSGAIQRNPAVQVGLLLLGLVLFGAGMYLVTFMTEGQRHLARRLISQPEIELAEQVHDLTRSRVRITTAFDEERRRIERDLHDGAQQRLTGLIMTLGSMRYQHDRGGDIGLLIDQAHADAHQAVSELRDIVHGIYPAALREHDLAEALDELADRAETIGLTTTVSIDLAVGLPTEVQVGLYFAVSELFTNISKHASATAVTLLVRRREAGGVLVTVEDNGRGGAKLCGTGLLGVIDRIETLGGVVTISSPAGGPTRVTLEVPCAS